VADYVTVELADGRVLTLSQINEHPRADTQKWAGTGGIATHNVRAQVIAMAVVVGGQIRA
jgi:hypothetical protein